MSTTFRKSMWRLAAIWFIGAGLIFIILVGQSLVGYYEPRTQDAWSWFLPTVMPTLLLIVGTLVAEYRKPDPIGASNPASPARGVFWLGAGLSAFYLVLVATSVLVQPFVSGTDPIEIMQRSNLWLGPVQGLCVAALGYFFHTQS